VRLGPALHQLNWEAVVALDHLPEPRQSAATIKIGGRVFTASEIDRLYHAKNK